MSAKREIRVHGIGDHQALSSQGSGLLVSTNGKGLDVFEAPLAPDHEVRFLNWSRTSQARGVVWWYLAFPYTLLNMAGAMAPEARWLRRIHGVIVFVVGIGLTLGTALWLLVLGETAARFWDGQRGDVSVSSLLAVVIGFAVVVLVVFRSFLVMKGPLRWPALVIHAGSVALLLVWLERVRPAANTGYDLLRNYAGPWPPQFGPPIGDWPGHECFIGEPVPYCAVFQNDFVTRAAIISVGVALGLSLVLLLLSVLVRQQTWRGGDAAPLVGTGVAILVATLALHVLWSGLRLALDWFLTYLDGFSGLSWINRETGTRSEDSILMALDLAEGPSYGLDIMGGLLLPVLVVGAALVATIVGIRWLRRIGSYLSHARRRKGEGKKGLHRSPRLPRFVHSFICDSSRGRLAAGVLVPMLFWATAVAGWLSWLDGNAFRTTVGWLSILSVASIHLFFVAIVLLFLLPTLRRPLAVLGDVAGYWDVRWHPLAARPYRHKVVEAIIQQLNDATGSVVLVGHSQGSILSFEALRKWRGPRQGKAHLVTCGSPLASVYARFFPMSFTEEARQDVLTKVDSWANFWRQTDPIGSPLDGNEIEDVVLADPASGSSKLHVHGDYWIEPQQRQWVADRE